MLSKQLIQTLKKQHYKLVGSHSAVKICRWTGNSLRDEGECYKQICKRRTNRNRGYHQ